MFNLDDIRGQAKKFNMELAIEGMTFQPQVVDGKATQKRAGGEEAGGELNQPKPLPEPSDGAIQVKKQRKFSS